MMYQQQMLGAEAQTLLTETMTVLDTRYDEAYGLLTANYPGYRGAHEVRASAHYALGLLIRQNEGDVQRAAKVIHAVLDTQLDQPEEIFHGTFLRAPEEAGPALGVLPYKQITPVQRYFADVTNSRIEECLLERLKNQEGLKEHAADILAQVRGAQGDALPIVWTSYDPNWREFVLCAMALILACFEELLPGELVARIEHAARLGMDGAMERSKRNLTPLNTNIEIMHVFVLDYFGLRLKDENARAYAFDYAKRFKGEYDEFHAIHEFNSPTYCGVDLTAIGYWRQFAPSPAIREMGIQLEAAIWEDVALFYHPGMDNLCGPFSRNYEMDMAAHTSLHALLFLGLGQKRFNKHPFNCESDHNPMLVLNGVEIPPKVQETILQFEGERIIFRQFRELSERGNPLKEQAVCTATAWMGENLMVGAMSGSRNISGQLHPVTAYWRDRTGGVSSMRMRRSDAYGQNDGYHMVVFNAETQHNQVNADVEILLQRDLEVYFEFECAAGDDVAFSQNQWLVSGLKVKVEAKAPQPHIRRMDETHWRVVYFCGAKDAQNKHMSFHLTFEREEE